MSTIHTLSLRIGGLDKLDDVRYAALVELDRLTIPPDELIDALRDERWSHAEGVLLASGWARTDPKRAARLARQLETGQHQGDYT